MSERVNADFDELKELVDRAFPNLRCLRCGNEAFLLATDVDALGTGRQDVASVLPLRSKLSGARRPVLTLACDRCGYLEYHVVGLLQRAEMPIPEADANG